MMSIILYREDFATDQGYDLFDDVCALLGVPPSKDIDTLDLKVSSATPHNKENSK